MSASRCSCYNLVFQATNCFVTESKHHTVNDFLVIKFAFFASYERSNHFIRCWINSFCFLAFLVEFVFVETYVILFDQDASLHTLLGLRLCSLASYGQGNLQPLLLHHAHLYQYLQHRSGKQGPLANQT